MTRLHQPFLVGQMCDCCKSTEVWNTQQGEVLMPSLYNTHPLIHGCQNLLLEGHMARLHQPFLVAKKRKFFVHCPQPWVVVVYAPRQELRLIRSCVFLTRFIPHTLHICCLFPVLSVHAAQSEMPLSTKGNKRLTEPVCATDRWKSTLCCSMECLD